MAPEYILETTGLSKNYGRIHAVRSLDLAIEKGGVFGLLGPNGSGKTTTLGMLLGVTVPSAGSFRWFSEDDSASQRRRIGAILEKPNFYPHLNAWKNLVLVAMIKGVPRDRISAVLERVGLYERRFDKFRTYSLGMKQRLAIASALLADPEVLVLDEPTNGLDPQGIADIRRLVREIGDMGKTIILASHLLDEVQKVCTRFAILRRGELIHQGRVDDDFSEKIVVEIASVNGERLTEVLSAHGSLLSLEKGEERVIASFKQGVTMEEIGSYLFEQRIALTHLALVKKNLEEQFLEIVEKSK
ncbi:ABC transporter ATP-binding protein [Myxococcota bacterium]|nr:ABC transporter ATP-binding protein [Myxococcota bacterium]MBU1535880.1 ABC transporter ATP-binding protein [Myxococcota bacterium]